MLILSFIEHLLCARPSKSKIIKIILSLSSVVDIIDRTEGRESF